MSALLAVSFGAGLLAPVNPCGFALLPAYLATFLDPASAGGEPGEALPAGRRLGAAMVTGAAVTAGFCFTVTAVGVALAVGLRSLIHAVPWISVAVGAVLVLAGAAMIVGVGVSVPLGRRAGRRARPATAGGGSSAGSSILRRAAFGAGYALASASCTIVVLLAVVTQAVSAGSVSEVVAVFAANIAGSAIILLALAVAAALANTALSSSLGRLARYLPRLSGLLLAVSGSYLLAYWLPELVDGSSPAQSGTVATTSATATNWISTHQSLVVAAALTLVLAAFVAAILTARRSSVAGCNCPPPSPTDTKHDSLAAAAGPATTT